MAVDALRAPEAPVLGNRVPPACPPQTHRQGVARHNLCAQADHPPGTIPARPLTQAITAETVTIETAVEIRIEADTRCGATP